MGVPDEPARSGPMLEYASQRLPPTRPFRTLVVPILCVVSAWIIGATTNAINAVVSSQYFDVVMGGYGRWPTGRKWGFGEIVQQGLLEATCFGIGFAVLFTVVYIATTATRCPLHVVIRSLGWAVGVALTFWLVGGLIGLAWGHFDRLTFEAYFIVPRTSTDSYVRRWAFVGGAIWGVYAGSVFGLIAAGVTLHFGWRRFLRTAM